MRRLPLPILVLGLSLGCAANDDGDVDSAAQGWRAASAAMQQVGDDLAVSEHGGPLSVRAACPEGGEIAVVGDADLAAFSATIRFEDCGAESVRIDGELSVSGEGSAQSLTVEYVGELDFRGAVETTCVVDMTATTSTQIEGTQVSAQARLSGSICGVEANLAAHAGS